MWDWDAISVTLFGNLTRQKTQQQMRVLLHMAAALRVWLASNEYAQSVWIIVSDRNVGQQIARQVRASVHEVEATKEECTERVRVRDSGCGYLDSRLKAIDAWFSVGSVSGTNAATKLKRFVPGYGATDLSREQMPERKASKQLYNSARWKNFRKHYLEQHPLCEDCLVMSKTTTATELHHITRLSVQREAALDEENIKPLCHDCHSKRTAAGE